MKICKETLKQMFFTTIQTSTFPSEKQPTKLKTSFVSNNCQVLRVPYLVPLNLNVLRWSNLRILSATLSSDTQLLLARQSQAKFPRALYEPCLFLHDVRKAILISREKMPGTQT